MGPLLMPTHHVIQYTAYAPPADRGKSENLQRGTISIQPQIIKLWFSYVASSGGRRSAPALRARARAGDPDAAPAPSRTRETSGPRDFKKRAVACGCALNGQAESVWPARPCGRGNRPRPCPRRGARATQLPGVRPAPGQQASL